MKRKSFPKDAIDREIEAMTPEEFLAAFLAMAGAWADMEDLTDEGFSGKGWGFMNFLDSEEHESIQSTKS
jgi:hypothetical protein